MYIHYAIRITLLPHNLLHGILCMLASSILMNIMCVYVTCVYVLEHIIQYPLLCSILYPPASYSPIIQNMDPKGSTHKVQPIQCVFLYINVLHMRTVDKSHQSYNDLVCIKAKTVTSTRYINRSNSIYPPLLTIC